MSDTATATQPQPKVTELQPKTEQQPPPAAAAPVPAIIHTGENYQVGFDNRNGFELIQRAAKLLSQSSLVPKDYQGPAGMPNCVIALNMAHRIGADPLMVMQNLYVVHGRPSWSAQFLIATFNTCGRFTALRFEFFGTKNADDWGCRAWAVEKATGEKLYGADINLTLAKAEGWYGKAGSKWKTMTQQMLMYRSAAWFVRAYAPELAMGLQTSDEIEDIGPGSYDVSPAAVASAGITIEGTAAEVDPAKSNLENFKDKHADKAVTETVNKETGEVTATPTPTPTPKPAMDERIAKAEKTTAKPKSCETCVGTGIVHGVEDGQEFKGPCPDCNGAGKV